MSSTTSPTPPPPPSPAAPTPRRRRFGALVAAGLLTATLAACGGGGGDAPAGGGGGEPVTLGFAQVGAESGWRTANTTSIQEAAAPAGVDLKFADAQQKQENQIKAIRSFIQQRVDVIAFSPVVKTGWDTVLQEARRANIPVVLTDRAVDSADPTLVRSFIGSDFVEEGHKAGNWLLQQYQGNPAPVSIVQIEGTTGAAPAIDRDKGLRETIGAAPNMQVVASQTGDFTRSGGKQVMEAFLKSQPRIDVLVAQNDDEALGAIEAIEAAGKVPGRDIKIIASDATRDGMTALSQGKINFIVECNPLLGPDLMGIVKAVHAGQPVPPRVVVQETTFDQAQATQVLQSRKY